jgi:ubiquinone/menaquinone biosynthesis C-methylase UbiE
LNNEGYKNQVCIDFSEVVIKEMSTQFAAKEGIDWKVADVRHMTDFSSASFDAAIDKGTLDAMIHGSLWDPPKEVRNNTGQYIDEVSLTRGTRIRVDGADLAKQVARVLKPGGVFIYITYRQPHFMKKMLIREGIWDLQTIELKEDAGTFEYFSFVMTKK